MQEIVARGRDELIDGGDPAKVWDQFAGWVQQEVASAASANFVWATQRARAAARQVAEHFADGRTRLRAARDRGSTRSGRCAQMVDPLAQPDAEGFGVGQKALTGCAAATAAC